MASQTIPAAKTSHEHTTTDSHVPPPFPLHRATALLALALLCSAGQAWAQPAGNAGTTIDYAAELRQTEQLAQQGHAVAQFNLGLMHDFGRGTPKDPDQAVKWYRLAAAQGHGGAQFNLGGMYFEGLGVPRDLVRATMWFKLSAAAGIPGAAKNRSAVAGALTPAQLARAQEMATVCRRQQFQGCD